MRTLILENTSEVKYYVPLTRSFIALTNGFSTQEIEDIKKIISGGKAQDDFLYSTEIIFNRDELVSLVNTGVKNLAPAVDSIEIRSDIDDDPITDDMADIIKAKINNKISASKKAKYSDKNGKPESEFVEIANMSASKNLVDMIKEFEGFRAYPYTCPGGSLTIGYGNAIKPGEYNSISKEQAEVLLRKTISVFERGIKKAVKVPLTQNQYDALVSFAYNVGMGAFRRSTLLKKLNAKDYQGAADELLRFTKSNGKVLRGLVKRRERERALFLT